MRNLLLGSLLWLAGASAVRAEELVRDVSWSALAKAGKLTSGEVVRDAKLGQEILKVENKEASPKTINILDLEQPGVKSIHYAINGRVRYDDVQKGYAQNQRAPQVGYLEMWNCFANGGMYFSRTLGDSGPFQYLEGTSDWRPFSLPFFSEEKVGTPTRLIVNVVLPGRGTVYLSPLRVVQFKPGEDVFAVPGAWWGEGTAGWIGGIVGGVGGLVGAVIGVLVGLGKARRFVLALASALTALGIVALGAGLVAVLLRQPYAVYYPLLLGGVIAACVMGFNLPKMRRRYEELELRKMAAMDVANR